MQIPIAFVATSIVLGWVFYNVFVKLAADHIHPLAGFLTMYLVATVIGLMCLVGVRMGGIEMTYTKQGVFYAIIAGITLVIAEIGLFYLYAKGATLTVYMPVMAASTAALLAIIGFVFLKEEFNLRILLGITLAIGSLLLLSKG